jgi:MFS family permease
LLTRFRLYGVLKNQRYYEPFLMLALLERGMNFTTLGWLVAARALTLNVFEVPSGVLSDVWGRRRTLMLAFVTYIVALVWLGSTRQTVPTFVAVLLLGLGDALRSGTHKALIFEWLLVSGRLQDRARVYGLTRSWSKIGSAVSIPIGALLVLAFGRYESTFLATAPVYVAALINLQSYPGTIDVRSSSTRMHAALIRHGRESLRRLARGRRSRRLLLESIGFDGRSKSPPTISSPSC